MLVSSVSKDSASVAQIVHCCWMISDVSLFLDYKVGSSSGVQSSNQVSKALKGQAPRRFITSCFEQDNVATSGEGTNFIPQTHNTWNNPCPNNKASRVPTDPPLTNKRERTENI